ncbi:uncharacterized protein KRP23_8683 [Phytophthora ramorum]|uniref:uncharacterized protein n=1 Tax=Phytophthora ramorum TaxID=164328 RepID=UPI003097BE52|nr:hypothetical protein KRP23_8683 [Phytophthora ramorum]
MGTGEHWGKPRDTPSLRELEQLRVLAMYEFEPPLSSQELVAALRACDNRTEDAYEYIKASRRHQCSIATPASASAPAATSMATPDREKRRMSQSSVDDNVAPSKRRKDLSFVLLDEEEKEEEKDTTPETQQDAEAAPTAADCARAQQILQQTVEDRVAARQPLRNPEWVTKVWQSLQVPEVLELAMQLNLTVDALARWVKFVETQNAQDIQTRGAALTIEVAASLPPVVPNAEEVVACSPKDEVLLKKDEEVAAVVLAENQAAELSAFARANTAKNAIECMSSACKAYMDRLGWFRQSNSTISEEKTKVQMSLETLSQKLASLAEGSTREVKAAERSLLDAKQTKENRSQRILDFVRKRHEELLADGETEASASLQSVVEVWKRDDDEVQALWSSRSDSEERVDKFARELMVANYALTFHQNLNILFRKVRKRREEALRTSSKCLEKARMDSEARATPALEGYIPMLARALFKYYEFHSIQQSKAKEELQEQEKALEAHNEYFGDSAPIKKGDIEKRIREFIGVTQSSMQVIMEIAEGQEQLWKQKDAVLPASVRLVLIREFKALWLQLSGPMRDVMKKFVATIEAAAGGVVAVEPPQQPPQQPAVPVLITANAIDEVIPAFTLPTFTNSHAEAVTPYRTAISAIVAPTDAKSDSNSPRAEKDQSRNARTQSPACSDETRGATETPEPQKPPYEFDVGSTLYSKIPVGENCTQFIRGVALKQLENGMYLMQYDNGDKFSVGSSFLFTKELMEQNLKAGGATAPDQDTDMEVAEEAQDKSSEGNCAIM